MPDLYDGAENGVSSGLVAQKENPILDQSTHQIKWKECWPQAIACCFAHCLVIQVGATMSFSAILLPQLDSNESDIKLTMSESSWIASLLTISLPLGSLTSGILMDHFGRKNLCILTTFPYIISWLLQATASSVWHLYLARILAGVSGGLSTAAIVYVTEVSHPNYRAMFLALNSSFVSFGILLTCVLGYFFYWRTMAYVFSGVAFVTVILLWIIPESPIWIISFRKSKTQCAKSVQWLYRDPLTCEHQLRHCVQNSASRTVEESRETIAQQLKVLKEPIVYRPLFILIVLFVFQQLSGIYVIIFYAINIFRDIRGNFDVHTISEYACIVFLGIIRLIMSIITTVVSKKLGRRPLLMISGLGMTLSGFGIGFHLSGLFSITCLLLYISFGALGYVVIPWALIGELLPIKVRGKLAGVMVAVAYLLMFSVVKSFPYILSIVNIHTIFYGFTFCNLLGIIFVYFSLPETLGKSFKEIEDNFKRNQ